MLPPLQVFAQLRHGSPAYASEIFSVSRGERRRRAEIAVGAPGESVSLYDVRSGTQIARYALPPNTRLSCAPLSVHQRTKDGQLRRLTYAVTYPEDEEQARNDQRSGGPTRTTTVSTVHAWIERYGKSVPLEERLSSHRCEEKSVSGGESGQDDAVHLSVLSNLEDGDDLAIFSVLRCGSFRSYSESLEHGRLTIPGGSRSDTILASGTIELEQAKKTILSHREDLISGLEAAQGCALLITLERTSKPEEALAVRITALKKGYPIGYSSAPETGGYRDVKFDTILTTPLPEPFDKDDDDDESFHFDKSLGRLFRLSGRRIHTYDLFQIGGVAVKTTLLDTKVDSFYPVSTSSVAYTADNLMAILSLTYDSQLFAERLDVASLQDGSSNPRTNEWTEPARLLASFSFGTIICQRGKTVFSVNTKGAENSRKRSTASLADAVCKGIRHKATKSGDFSDKDIPSSIGKLILDPDLGPDWLEHRQKLEKYAQQRDSRKFQKAARKFLALESEIARESDKLVQFHSRRSKVAALLGLMFSVVRSDRGGPCDLELRVVPEKQISWMARFGAFSQSAVEQALKQARKLSPAERLPPCAFVRAVAEADGTLDLLVFLLASPLSLETSEVISAMDHSLRILKEEDGGRKMITDGNASESESDAGSAEEVSLVEEPAGDGGGAIVNIDDETAEDSGLEFEPKTHNAHAIMKSSLSRLSSTAPSAITSAFRSIFSPQQLLELINYLRYDLAGGRWLEPYILDMEKAGTLHDDDPTVAHNPGYLAAVARVLNCCLDALGIDSLLLQSSKSGDDGVEAAGIDTTLAHMSAEVSAALEGVEESAYLQGLLREILLYAKTAPEPPPSARDAIDSALPSARNSDDGEEQEGGDGVSGSGNALTNRSLRTPRKLETQLAADGTRMVKPVRLDRPHGLGGAVDGTLDGVLTNSLPVGLNLGEGLGLPDGATMDNVVKAGGKVQKRTKRDIGRLKDLAVGRYSFERIVL